MKIVAEITTRQMDCWPSAFVSHLPQTSNKVDTCVAQDNALRPFQGSLTPVDAMHIVRSVGVRQATMPTTVRLKVKVEA